MSFSMLSFAKTLGSLSRDIIFKNTVLQTIPKRFSHLFDYSHGDGIEEDTLYKNIEVEIKGHDTAVMNSYETFLKMAAGELGVNISRTWTPPKHFERWTLLKSAHIYRKHMVQYESRTHYRVFELKLLTGSTADTLLEYIQRNLPEGMAMKVTRKALVPIPEFMLPSQKEATKKN